MTEARYLTRRADELLRELVESRPLAPAAARGFHGIDPAQVVQSTAAVGALESATFLRLRNRPDTYAEDDGQTIEAYALGAMGPADRGLLLELVGKQSGGYFAVLPIASIAGPSPTSGDDCACNLAALLRGPAELGQISAADWDAFEFLCCEGGTACANVNGGRLPGTINASMSGVIGAANPANPWVPDWAAFLNAAALELSQELAAYTEQTLTLGTITRSAIPLQNCQRGQRQFGTHAPFPGNDYTGGVRINGFLLEVFLEFNNAYQAVIPTMTIQPGDVIGDPFAGGSFEFARGPLGVGDAGFEVWSFASPITAAAVNIFSELTLSLLSKPLLQDGNLLDMSTGPGLVTIPAQPVPPPPPAALEYLFNTAAELPAASGYQAGQKVIVCNDGANTGVWIATGAKGGAASAWTKS